MKKQAKKKATTKKNAKKKVAINKIVITLEQSVGATPHRADAKRHKPSGPGDKVRWWNKTSKTLKLTFGAWPFVEPERTITIAAGKKSRWFSIDSGARAGRHAYTVVPSIAGPKTPPDSPSVIIGG